MKVSCKVVEDLLPLYIDDVLSEESRKIVEEHLKICVNCTYAIESMKRESSLPIIKDESKILKKISIRITKKTILYTFSILFLILFYLLYFTERYYQIYYDIHFLNDTGVSEYLSVLMILVPMLLMIAWLLYLIKCRMDKALKERKRSLLILGVYVFLSVVPIAHMMLYPIYKCHTLSFAYNLKKESVVVEYNYQKIELSIPAGFQKLIKADHKTYYIIDFILNNDGKTGKMVKIEEVDLPIMKIDSTVELEEKYKKAYLQCLNLLKDFDGIYTKKVRVHDTTVEELELGRRIYGEEQFEMENGGYWTFEIGNDYEFSIIVRRDAGSYQAKTEIGFIHLP